MPACPRLLLSLRPSKPGKRNLCVLSWKGGVQGHFKNGKRTRGERFCSPWAPEAVPWGRSPSRNPRSSVLQSKPAPEGISQYLFPLLLGTAEEESDHLCMSSPAACRLPRRGGPATCREVFSSVFSSTGAFWPKIFCSGFILSLSPADCCLWEEEVLEPRRLLPFTCYLLSDIFSLISSLLSLLVKGDRLKLKGR